MIKIYYIEDKNGKYVSEDGSKRWTRLTGEELYDFLQTERGKNTFFYTAFEENGIEIGIEISNLKDKNILRAEMRHSRYIFNTQKEKGYTTVSFDYFETVDGTSIGDEVIPNDDESIEDDVIRHIDLEILRNALSSLSEDEYALIHALFLQRNPMTEREYAKIIGVPRTTIEYRKKSVLQKLKKFF